jgi:hypothetical protein
MITGAQLNTASVSFQPFKRDIIIAAINEVMRYIKMLIFSPIPACILSRSLSN